MDRSRWWDGTTPAVSVSVIVLLVLSCGDGILEPPPSPPPPSPPAPVATTVTVTPASATLTALEETVRFTSEVRDQNGQVMAGAEVGWASSDASVAAVDASGQVTAAANGSATITATAGSASGTAAVTVAQVVTAVAVSPPPHPLLAVGDTVRLLAEASDANGHTVEGAGFSWSSSDAGVARVDETGLVSGVAEGTATITAVSGGASDTAAVRVRPTRSPEIAASIADLRLYRPTQWEATTNFRDPDGDTLTYTVETSEAIVAFGYVNDRWLGIVPVGQGSATLRVTATDPVGGVGGAELSGDRLQPAPLQCGPPHQSEHGGREHEHSRSFGLLQGSGRPAAVLSRQGPLPTGCCRISCRERTDVGGGDRRARSEDGTAGRGDGNRWRRDRRAVFRCVRRSSGPTGRSTI